MAGRLAQRPSSDCCSRAASMATLRQGICVVDADLSVVRCDRRFLELLDYPPELGQTGRPVTDWSDSDRARPRRPMAARTDPQPGRTRPATSSRETVS